jgi:hypothetical protein
VSYGGATSACVRARERENIDGWVVVTPVTTTTVMVLRLDLRVGVFTEVKNNGT